MTWAPKIAIAPTDRADKQQLFVYPASVLYGLIDGCCARKSAIAIFQERVCSRITFDLWL
jgi:hypothetical protein